MAEEDINMHMEEDELAPPEESGNRTFIIVAGALGAIMLATLICMGIYALVIAPNLADRRATQVAEINAQNTQVAEAAKLTAEAASWTATPTITPTPVPVTDTPTPTEVLRVPTTVVATPTANSLTQTVEALLLTQTALAGPSGTTTPTSTALPETGFVDDVGVPGLLGLTLVLVVVIFLARRLRTAGA